MALKYKKEDYDRLKKSFYKNPNINPITGREIKANNVTYKKLVTEFGDPFKVYTFNQFEELPEELQSEIYSQDVDTLKHARIVSQKSQKVTRHQLCEFKINKKEYVDYIQKYLPEVTYAFPISSKDRFNVTKFILVKYPTNGNQPGYTYLYIKFNKNKQ